MQPVEKFSGELREVRECKEQIKQLERGKRQLELYLKNADERVVIEQSIALRHTEQSSALEFDNRRLHVELTFAQNMLADRQAMEERILHVQRKKEHQTFLRPISQPKDSGEAILYGAIGILVLMICATIRRQETQVTSNFKENDTNLTKNNMGLRISNFSYLLNMFSKQHQTCAYPSI